MLKFPAGQKNPKFLLVSSQLFKFAKVIIISCTLMVLLFLPKCSFFVLNSIKIAKKGQSGKYYNPLVSQ